MNNEYSKNKVKEKLVIYIYIIIFQLLGRHHNYLLKPDMKDIRRKFFKGSVSKKFDLISNWKKKYYRIRKNILNKIEKELEFKKEEEKNMANYKHVEFTDQEKGRTYAYVNFNEYVCPWCKGNLITKHGRYGSFEACNNFPKCRYTRSIN